jgi:hypothetical protein
MIVQLANDPLPYRPINVIDVSPLHSSIEARPARASRWARLRSRIVGALGVVIVVALVIVGVGAASASADDRGFELAPGHAMPPSLMR